MPGVEPSAGLPAAEEGLRARGGAGPLGRGEHLVWIRSPQLDKMQSNVIGTSFALGNGRVGYWVKRDGEREKG